MSAVEDKYSKTIIVHQTQIFYGKNTCTLKCLSIGTHKAINFPFVSNEKIKFF